VFQDFCWLVVFPKRRICFARFDTLSFSVNSGEKHYFLLLSIGSSLLSIILLYLILNFTLAIGGRDLKHSF